MLKSIKKKHKEILWLLVLIIIPGFTLFGISSVFKRGGRGPSHAGTMFGRKVTFEQFGESWQAVRNQAVMSYGYEQLQQIAKYINFEQQAWQRLIMLQDARKKGVKVTNRELIDYIASLPMFQTEGKFDPELYDARLKLLFFDTPAKAFEEQMKESLTISKLYDSITESANVTEEDIIQAYKTDTEKIKIEYLLFPQEKYKDKIDASPEQIQKFYNKNSANYKKPDQVDVDYVCVLFDSFLEEVKKGITEEELQEYYQDNKERFLLPKENSDTDDKTTTDEEPKQQYKPFEEVREQILDTLSQQGTSMLAKKQVETIYDELIESNSLKKTAEKHALPVQQTGFFSQQDLIPGGIGFSRDFIEEAFKRPLGEYSDIIQTTNGFYIIQPRKKKKAYIPELAEVEADIKNDFISEQALLLARHTAEETKEKLNEIMKIESISLEEAAKKLSLDIKESKFVSRADSLDDIGPCSEITQIFEEKAGSIGPVIEISTGSLLFSPVEFQPFDENKFTEEEKDKYRQKLLDQKKQQIYSEYMTELSLRADLRSNLDKAKR